MPVITVRKNNTYTADDLFQWDVNRVLEIYGLNLPSLPEIHFANTKMSKAIVKQATTHKNGVIKVEIPNILLETSAPIRVFVCTYEGEEFISRYSLTINVKARPKPEDYIAEDDEKIYSYNALENLVNNTIVNLREENATFRDNMIAEMDERFTQLKNEVDKTCDDVISEVENVIGNMSISEADTLDGYHAEDFEIVSKPGKTIFQSNGDIVTTYDDGSTETVSTTTTGGIMITRQTRELGTKTEIVTFASNGSIIVRVV